MSAWFGGGRKAPERVPTDTVLPIRYWDDTVVLKSLVVYSMAKYDIALDGERLRDALERLVGRDGWRKLGARLRRNDKGELEYHIPTPFTAARPAVTYSSVRHDGPISDHPLASQIPRPSDRPAVVGDPEQFTPLVRPPGSPAKLDDYLLEDRGQVGLHVVAFADATLVVLYYNHTAFDLMGWGALMAGWTHMLHGRDDLVPTPIGLETEGRPAGFDPCRDLGTSPTEPHVLASHRMPLSSLAGYGLRNALGLAVWSKENRMVCIPGGFVDRLRARALAELAAAGVEKPFLSDGDVLAAWWTRLTVGQLVPAGSTRTVSIQYAASARKALDGSVPGWDSSRPYVSNMFTILYTLVPAGEMLAQPVSALAHRYRRSIVEQGTRAQVEAYLAIQRAAPGRMLPAFGDAGMHMMTLSNWCKADLYGQDLSPAAVDPAGRARPQYASYVQASQLPFSFPEGFLVVGQDRARNYWMYGFRVAGLWARVEQALAEMDVEMG